VPGTVSRDLMLDASQLGWHDVDLAVADATLPVPRRALLSVSDKTGLVDLGRGLVWQHLVGLRRGLRDANVSIKRWPMRSKRKSTRISIGKSQRR